MKKLFTISLLAVLVVLSGCRFGGRTVHGSGNTVKQDRTQQGFTKLKIYGPFEVLLQQSDSYKVELETDDNLQQYVEVRKEGSELVIKLQDNLNISNDKGMKLYINVPEIEDLSVAGSTDVKAQGNFVTSRKMTLDIAGSGEIDMRLKAPELEVSIAGSGTAKLEGETRNLDISIAGSGDYLAEKLLSENAKVSVSGAGNCRLYASKTLDVSVAGSGDIFYHGKPTIKQSIAGSGNITALDN
jgi:hypothetical protein